MRNTAAWSACPRRCCGSLLLFCGPRPSGRLQRQQKEGPAEARTRQHPGRRHLLPSRHSSGPQEQLEAARRGYRNRMLLGQFTLHRYPRLQNKYKSGSNNLSKKMCPAGGNTGTQINQLSIDGGFFLFILRACCNFHIKLFLKQPSLLYSNWSISMKFLCSWPCCYFMSENNFLTCAMLKTFWYLFEKRYNDIFNFLDITIFPRKMLQPYLSHLLQRGPIFIIKTTVLIEVFCINLTHFLLRKRKCSSLPALIEFYINRPFEAKATLTGF